MTSLRSTIVSFLAATLALTSVTGCEAQHPVARPATAAGTAQIAKAHTDSGPAHTWHMKRVSQDGDIGLDAMPQWGTAATPHKHVTIVSMLVPSDWTFKTNQASGNPMDCNLNSGKLILFATSPDKKSVFYSKPVPDTAWSNDRNVLGAIVDDNRQFSQNTHCIIEQPQPLANRIPVFAKEIAPGSVAGGNLEPIPELSGKLDGMLRQANANLAQQSGGRSQLTAEAGRMRFTLNANGDSGEGYLYAMQVHRTDQLPSGGFIESTSVPMLFFTGTPVGQLKSMESMFAAMAGSIQIDPDYQAECLQTSANITHMHQVTKQRLAQIASEVQADNARTAANIANIQAGVQQYRSQVMTNVAANRSAALEHSSQQFSLYMGDQAQYRDPSSGHNVILPSGSSHVWASSTGNSNEYILTDSASYNPNGHVGNSSWSQMEMQH